MLDFLRISQAPGKNKTLIISPTFVYCKSKDLMTRGGDFYALWDEDKGLWITDEFDATVLIDRELKKYYESNKENIDSSVVVQYLWNTDNGMIDKWHKYVQKQSRDHFVPLDENIIFSNKETTREDYASKKLNYPLARGDITNYNQLMSVLYSPEERRKIEWAIGAVVSGDSKHIQKFIVMYGAAGTGKSTVLNIIQELFDGYYTTFDSRALGSSSDSFALEPFKNNPLVAIQHDGDLSHIEDNTRLNSLVSHELMTVNAKYSKLYTMRFNSFLFMGTNKPVKITDSKSGLLRRLIDVSPTGNKIPLATYNNLIYKIKFELGAIAEHCLSVYKEDPGYYDNYVPVGMLGASNDFYNFICDNEDVFIADDEITLGAAWKLYKDYCSDANITYPYTLRVFREEFKSYFNDFQDRAYSSSGERVRSLYSGFKREQVSYNKPAKAERNKTLKFEDEVSDFDQYLRLAPAQYAKEDGSPRRTWDSVTTTLKDLDTHKLHYVRLNPNHIVIDFDLKDRDGNKSFKKNVEAASKWPETYAEISKSGEGIHLHYFYDGDVSMLDPLYSENIEVKVFTGKSSLRRKLTKCHNHEITTINSGLPLRKEKAVIAFENLKNERQIRSRIVKCLNKEHHGATKPEVDFIFKTLEDAYNDGIRYDVSDMKPAIISFAAKSSHQAEKCMEIVSRMKFASEEPSENMDTYEKDEVVFFDVEVFPNLLVVVYKAAGKPCVKMINPSPSEIEHLCKFKLVGFNNRRYDNHILYARMMGYTNKMVYDVSKRIIGGNKTGFFGEAYNLSYTDIYDFSSKKQGLKKFEIDLGLHHQELDLDWNEPVPEELWPKVADYCCNDVIATEATYNSLSADFKAREMLSDVADMSPNDTTNSLTTRIILGKERHPNLVYTDLATGEMSDGGTSEFINAFPGYEYRILEDGKPHNLYLGEDVGFGGYVYSEPGMYGRTVTYDSASHHPRSMIALRYFGDYTSRFEELLDARIAIKHKDFAKAKTLLGGKLAKYLTDEKQAKAISYALKIAINSCYGLTSASFENPMRDERNKNNIVALRGALFMVNLRNEVQKRGFTVAHIKTDSIKVVEPTKEIEDFIFEYSKEYGYNFEVEHVFEKFCLVNDAVYIAKCAEDDPEIPGIWTATGTQFAVPYVFKTLFSHEPITFEDVCETKSVTTALYLDFNESIPQLSKEEITKLNYIDKAYKSEEPDQIREVTYKLGLSPEEVNELYLRLLEKEKASHDYRFVGRVGLFCPIRPGCGGGLLLREKDGKYSFATGSKGYRWMEAATIEHAKEELPAIIDLSYYDTLVDEAMASIEEYGNFKEFVS